MEFSILRKNERTTRENYPKSSYDGFFKYFVRFLEELIIPKIAFDIK